MVFIELRCDGGVELLHGMPWSRMAVVREAHLKVYMRLDRWANTEHSHEYEGYLMMIKIAVLCLCNAKVDFMFDLLLLVV